MIELLTAVLTTKEGFQKHIPVNYRIPIIRIPKKITMHPHLAEDVCTVEPHPHMEFILRKQYKSILYYEEVDS